ncbi:MAG TPA: cytochrome C oxidase subunit IV family protein [Phycisphaerae bacterium]
MTSHPSKSPSVAFLLAIYAALLTLLALTVIAAHYPLGSLALLIALGIAAAKSILVVLYYMHVRYSSRATWIFVIAGFIWLTILFCLTFAEYSGRRKLPRAQPLTPGAMIQPVARSSM